jgi:hypothetical protein
LTEFSLPPLELFSLEEKAALLPGGLFVYPQTSILVYRIFSFIDIPEAVPIARNFGISDS